MQQCVQEIKNGLDSESQEAEWEQENPHDRVRQYRKESQRPAEKEEDEPEKESYHGRFYYDGMTKNVARLET